MRPCLLAFILAACGPAVTKYNVDSEDPRVSAHAIDSAIELLDTRLAAAGLVSRGVSIRTISDNWLVITWHTEIPFDCDMIPAAGCTRGHLMDIGYNACLGHTALVHELTHYVMGWTLGTQDYDHLRRDWWQVTEAADNTLAAECDP